LNDELSVFSCRFSVVGCLLFFNSQPQKEHVKESDDEPEKNVGESVNCVGIHAIARKKWRIKVGATEGEIKKYRRVNEEYGKVEQHNSPSPEFMFIPPYPAYQSPGENHRKYQAEESEYDNWYGHDHCLLAGFINRFQFSFIPPQIRQHHHKQNDSMKFCYHHSQHDPADPVGIISG
jgi:hypothetical protein